jgi:hypothetical protein
VVKEDTMTDEKSTVPQQDTSKMQQATEKTTKLINPKPKKGEEPNTKLLSNKKKRKGDKDV